MTAIFFFFSGFHPSSNQNTFRYTNREGPLSKCLLPSAVVNEKGGEKNNKKDFVFRSYTLGTWQNHERLNYTLWTYAVALPPLFHCETGFGRVVWVLFTKLTAHSLAHRVVLTENSHRDAHDRTRPSLSSVPVFFSLSLFLSFSLQKYAEQNARNPNKIGNESTRPSWLAVTDKRIILFFFFFFFFWVGFWYLQLFLRLRQVERVAKIKSPKKKKEKKRGDGEIESDVSDATPATPSTSFNSCSILSDSILGVFSFCCSSPVGICFSNSFFSLSLLSYFHFLAFRWKRGKSSGSRHLNLDNRKSERQWETERWKRGGRPKQKEKLKGNQKERTQKEYTEEEEKTES